MKPGNLSHRERQMINKNLIVFDMDGVIIDVSESYRDTVRQTARLFFKDAPGWDRLPDPLFSLDDLAGIKQSGGLNNDWALTYHVLDLLMTRVNVPDLSHKIDPWLLHQQTLRACNIEGLIDFLASHEYPLNTLHKKTKGHHSPFIAALSSNEVGRGNVIKQIFQEIYLGQYLFRETYHLRSSIYMGEGLINKETLLIEPAVFQSLGKENMLAIATGRPETEAEYALRHFEIRAFFSVIFSLDDCLREENNILNKEHKTISLSKPHPFMLDAIAEIHAREASQRYYIGDMPDDMLAANRSAYGYTGIGMITAASDKAKLRQALLAAGAGHVVRDTTELQKLLAH